MTAAASCLRQAIFAIRKELATVPPHGTAAQTLLAELAQLYDMLDRRETHRDRAAC